MWAPFVDKWQSITDLTPYDKIVEKLEAIEKTYDVKIIYACESGSRMWGLNLPDSDYDVRFVYIRNPRDYMRINRFRDVIEVMSDDRMLDIVGWDIQKFLQLARKSNVSTYEWLVSPIEYMKDPRFPNLEHLLRSYSVNLMYWHYWGLGRSLYDKFESNSITKKKMLYIVRSWLCCEYIMQRTEKPPIELDELLVSCDISDELREDIQRLNDTRSNDLFVKSEYVYLSEWVESSRYNLCYKKSKDIVNSGEDEDLRISNFDLETIFLQFVDAMERIS